MSKLLDILPQCGSQAFDTLCEILADISPPVVDILKSPLPSTIRNRAMTWLAKIRNMFG